MARIRSIKPDFFRHEVLQDLEITNPGSYPMMVFAGLWGHCDSKGRFEWRPRQLKLDILPFLPFDMTATLEILERAGMVNRYSVEGKEYGEIPTFEKHQRLSGKEATEGEKHPSPTREAIGKQQGSDREIPESQEGKGMEEEDIKPLLSGLPDVNQANGKKKLSESCIEVLNFLNEKTGRRYQPVRANINLIASRLRDGATVDQCRQVIAKKCREWRDDPNREIYLRPKTLFNATNFANYQGEIV